MPEWYADLESNDKFDGQSIISMSSVLAYYYAIAEELTRDLDDNFAIELGDLISTVKPRQEFYLFRVFITEFDLNLIAELMGCPEDEVPINTSRFASIDHPKVFYYQAIRIGRDNISVRVFTAMARALGKKNPVFEMPLSSPFAISDTRDHINLVAGLIRGEIEPANARIGG